MNAHAAAAAPTIFHSPNDDGEPVAEPLEIPPSQSVTLHIYVDGAPATPAGAVCSAGTGDELCGWTLRMQGAAGLSISSFIPSAGA